MSATPQSTRTSNPTPFSFIKKINDTSHWYHAKQLQYQWVYLATEKTNQQDSTKKEQIDADDYQIGYLTHLAKAPAIKDIWQLQTVLGDLYLINASDYIQGITGIYPYHQEIHTQEWLIICLEQQIKAHWPQLQIKHLYMVDALPKKIQTWQLQINDEFLHFAASEEVWHKVLKTLHALPKAKLSTQNIPLQLTVLLGQTQLPQKQYQSLAVNDIIYLDRSYFNSEGEGFCAVGDWQIELYYQNQHFYFKEWNATSMSTIENPYDEIFDEDDDSLDDNDLDEDDEDDEDANDSDDSDDSEDLDDDILDDENDSDDSDDSDDDYTSEHEDDESDDYKTTQLKADRLESKEASDSPEIMPPFKNIPVLLNFSLGQLKMSLAELSELTEGALLPLASNDAAVTIYANHHPVARGEVVMIDERLAVQITEILEK